jgi:hypothetical protein
MEIQKLIEEIKKDSKKLMELRNENKLVNKITKALVLGKDMSLLADELIQDRTLLKNVSNTTELHTLLKTIDEAIEKNSKEKLSTTDFTLLDTEIINLLSRDVRINEEELLSDMKVLMTTRGHDEELLNFIGLVKKKYFIDISDFNINPNFLVMDKDAYIEEEKDGEFIATVNGFTNTGQYVWFYDKTKVCGIGYIDRFEKQGYVQNKVIIHPLFMRLPDGTVTKELSNRGILCKGVPLKIVSDTFAKEIISKFQNVKDELVLGASLSGIEIRKIGDQIQFETLSIKEFAADAEPRIAVIGAPGSGKTVFVNSLLKQVMTSDKLFKGGVVTLTWNVEHLANVGEEFEPFEDEENSWSKEKSFPGDFKNKLKLSKTLDHSKIEISSSAVPDINKLDIETLFALIDSLPGSEMVKIAFKKNLQETDNREELFKSASDGGALSEIYSDSQNEALQRLVNGLMPANYETISKINIKDKLCNSSNMSFLVKGENGHLFATIVLLELYNLQKNKTYLNPTRDGRLLAIDECQKLAMYGAFKNIFDKIVLDGRNYGICLISIFQNQKEAKKIMPSQDFREYNISCDEFTGMRIVNVRDKRALIPPVAPKAKVIL